MEQLSDKNKDSNINIERLDNLIESMEKSEHTEISEPVYISPPKKPIRKSSMADSLNLV